MRLLYTLRYGSVAGNCGGDLRLFFTTQNAADWKPSPPAPPPAPGMWQGTNVAETLTLPTGDAIGITLDLLNNGQAAAVPVRDDHHHAEGGRDTGQHADRTGDGEFHAGSAGGLGLEGS